MNADRRDLKETAVDRQWRLNGFGGCADLPVPIGTLRFYFGLIPLIPAVAVEPFGIVILYPIRERPEDRYRGGIDVDRPAAEDRHVVHQPRRFCSTVKQFAGHAFYHQ